MSGLARPVPGCRAVRLPVRRRGGRCPPSGLLWSVLCWVSVVPLQAIHLATVPPSGRVADAMAFRSGGASRVSVGGLSCRRHGDGDGGLVGRFVLRGVCPGLSPGRYVMPSGFGVNPFGTTNYRPVRVWCQSNFAMFNKRLTIRYNMHKKRQGVEYGKPNTALMCACTRE